MNTPADRRGSEMFSGSRLFSFCAAEVIDHQQIIFLVYFRGQCILITGKPIKANQEKKMKQSALQNFKSNLVVGNRCAFSAAWCKLAIRTVTTVQTTKVAFTHPFKAGESWLDFPRASEIFETAPNNFSIIKRDNPVLHYDFSVEGIAAAEKNLA